MTVASSTVGRPRTARRHRGDRLAELVVVDADDEAVEDAVDALDRLLDLFGEDLLAAGVDAPGCRGRAGQRAVLRRPWPSRRGTSSARRRSRGTCGPTSPRPCSSRAARCRRRRPCRPRRSRAATSRSSSVKTLVVGHCVNLAVAVGRPFIEICDAHRALGRAHRVDAAPPARCGRASAPSPPRSTSRPTR